MAYLFDSLILNNQNDRFEITCYYIVDDDLKYVSLRGASVFFLHYVDTNRIGEEIQQSISDSDFDCFVISLHAPIETISSKFEKVNDKDTRVVRVVTKHGDNRIKKPKHNSDRNIIVRYKSSRNKLF